MSKAPMIGDRPLADPVLVHDLAAEAERLRMQAPWQTRGHNAVTLVKHEDFRVVLMALQANARIHEHKAPGRISVHTLSGHVRLHLPSREVDLPAGQVLTLEHDVPHDVQAIEESVVLLTVAWPRHAAATT